MNILIFIDFSCKRYDISNMEDSSDAKTIYGGVVNQRKGQQRNGSASHFFYHECIRNEQIADQQLSPLLDLSPFAPPQNMWLPRS